MARLSGLQRDVLSLYRKCLREVRNKPVVGISPRTQDPILKTTPGMFTLLSIPVAIPAETGDRSEFQKHRSVNKKDFSTVEYLLRKGQRQLEMYASPGIRNIR
ncbi:Complex 1 LYR protein [Penicillium brevicompactum]|uniref:Complex 1 LYR protein n=1 Tax=Penicillium brevicompactum TaxID=5074 RepID=A0A9W9UKU3_PENBR|nr:Complex 1 LYR protein [Penicillium brevicompactum]